MSPTLPELNNRILDRLNKLHPKIIDLSLSRMERILSSLGNPEKFLPPIIHIAGTNGKGSTLAFLESILRASGLKVDSYISPHLVNFNERIRLNGSPISDQYLNDLLNQCEVLNSGCPITFFEITTAAAFLAFKNSAADILILEVGLGGRLDATNVISKPVCSAITSISIDHTQYLGRTLKKIAREKAGILKPGVPAIISAQKPEANLIIQGYAKSIGAPLFSKNKEWDAYFQNNTLYFEGFSKTYKLRMPSLVGKHQAENAGVAIACIEAVREDSCSTKILNNGLKNVNWPGRLQRITIPGSFVGWEIFLDGGHNVGAGEALADAGIWDDKPLHLILGMIKSKDPKEFLQPLASQITTITGIEIPNEPSSLSAQEICKAARTLHIQAYHADSIQRAMNRIHQEPVKGRILICGSLYLVGAILDYFSLPLI